MEAEPHRAGRDAVLGRDLFVLGIDGPGSFPEQLRLSSPRFACLIAWDARGAGVDEVAGLARRLLDAGAVYICAWGPDCERVHDIVDEEVVGSDPDPEDETCVMTTWHAGEPLSEAIGFVLEHSRPDECYERGCESTLGLAIGSPAWAEEIRRAFADPGEFCSQDAEAPEASDPDSSDPASPSAR